MDSHDKYGKSVLAKAFGDAYKVVGKSTEIDYGAGMPARIDGTISGIVAVEVESRTSKQVRGAVSDLICHPFPKKLLVLLHVHMSDPEITKTQCENILIRFIPEANFRVVLFKGSGAKADLLDDSKIVGVAVQELIG